MASFAVSIIASIVVSVLASIVLSVSAAPDFNAYAHEREKLINAELKNATGANITLTPEETSANGILMQWKNRELLDAYQNLNGSNYYRDYDTYKSQIPNSKVYQIIRKMPKGALLHVHSTMMQDAEYFLNLTYEHQDYLYVCLADDDLKFLYSAELPLRPCPDGWSLVSDRRNSSRDITDFDKQLLQHFTLQRDDADSIHDVWHKFEKVYKTMKSLIMFVPVREKFCYDSLQKLYDDNIMYVEFRTGLHQLYDLDNTIYAEMDLARLYQKVTKKFVEDHPDFIGAKLILTNQRKRDVKAIRKALKLALTLKEEIPEFFAGFDLVGQEDLGHPLRYFANVLYEVKDKINFYFHGGETNWQGMPPDENIIDAILLGTKRLGHGYALSKHPGLLEVIKKKDIAIEVNVISNYMLGLVHDVRNHPLSVYLSRGVPVVLSSDDPGVWGADPLSHDFFVAFMGVANRRADLRTLKQLALNSITYSALDDARKEQAMELFHRKWMEFVKDLSTEKYCLLRL